MALAWVLAQKPWMVPIPGTSKLRRVEENNAAASLELTAADLEELGAVAANTHITGDRYSPEHQARIDR